MPHQELREACANFSEEFIDIQRRQFRRLGVLADWNREYRTMDPAYEATICAHSPSLLSRVLSTAVRSQSTGPYPPNCSGRG